MYGENRIDDIKRVIKAMMSNVLARILPSFYVKLTRQTGRGAGEETPGDISAYFTVCFNEYFEKLNIQSNDISDYLKGKSVLEYGPGDVPGVGLLMYAYGASHVSCIDRFPLVKLSEKNVKVINTLIEKLDGEKKKRAISCLVDENDIQKGFKKECIEYLVKQNGLSNYTDKIDLIISRAVLEHVNDLTATFRDMTNALKKNGVAIHLVDLKSHGLHQKNILDFLSWPIWLWNLMYSNKGVPNRWRVDRYINIAENTPLHLRMLEPTDIADLNTVQEVMPYLSPIFKGISKEQLSWLGFWLVMYKDNTFMH